MLRKRAQVSENAERLAIAALAEAGKQFERAKRLLNDSSKYRGYGAHL